MLWGAPDQQAWKTPCPTYAAAKPKVTPDPLRGNGVKLQDGVWTTAAAKTLCANYAAAKSKVTSGPLRGREAGGDNN